MQTIALYAYNKNLETVINNLRQEFSILSTWFYDNYMVLNPGKCHFMLFGVKENEQFDLICNDITRKHSSHEKLLANKLSFDEHIINIYKTANKKLNALSRINHYMKQNQKEILLSYFIISHFSYCPLIWMFCSKKSTKKINAVHERSLRIIRNDYESLYPLLLEETHQITFHQRCNFYIFQTENPRSLKHGLDAIPYRASQLWQQVPTDIREAASLTLFKNRIKTWKCEDCPCRS